MLSMTVRRRGRTLGQKLRMFQSGAARQAASGAIADELLSLVDDRFDRRNDPYGNSWAPRAQPTGGWPLLEKTRDMRTNFFAIVIGGEIRLENTISYAGYHQSGTDIMPARKLVPDGALPHEWQTRLDRAVEAALRRI